MKENYGDIVIDRLHDRASLIKKRLIERYKATKPLRMEAKIVSDIPKYPPLQEGL